MKLSDRQIRILKDNGYEMNPNKPGLWARHEDEASHYIDFRQQKKGRAYRCKDGDFAPDNERLLRQIRAMGDKGQQRLF